MSYTDKTVKGQTDALTLEFNLAHPPAKVWRALTEPELLAQWLLDVVGLELAPGAAFTFHAGPKPGWDGRVQCRMLEIEPLHKLRFSWVVGEMDTVVSFTLAPTPTGTRMLLVHEGFQPDQKQNFGGARYGWRLMGDKLIALLAQSDGDASPSTP